MSTTYGTCRDIIKAFESAKASNEAYSVILVHEVPEGALVCDIHYGAYTVEGLHDETFSWVAVKRFDQGSDKKQLVAYYPSRKVHAVHIVESEPSKKCRCCDA